MIPASVVGLVRTHLNASELKVGVVEKPTTMVPSPLTAFACDIPLGPASVPKSCMPSACVHLKA
jgi:hypothetical protein